MYVDESGDSGLVKSQTDYFVLSGIVTHESSWRQILDGLVRFRQTMRVKYGLKLREEIHAGAMINKPGELIRIKRNERLLILRDFANALASIPEISVLNVVVDKRGKPSGYDVFEKAWAALIQRFENTIQRGNFPITSSPLDKGLILADRTDDKKLLNLLRRMRYFNPIPNRGHNGYRVMPINLIIEDPWLKDSAQSYFVQAADVVAYLLYQSLAPNAYIRKKGGQNYFARLQPVLNVHISGDRSGIVRL